MNRSTPGLPIHHQLPEPTQTHVIGSVMPSNHLILCCPPLLLPSIFPSIRVFSNESALHIRWPKYWSFSFSISLSSEYSQNSPGENTGVGSQSLLQGTFLTQGLNPGLQHCRQIPYHLSHHGNPGVFPTISVNKDVTVISTCSPPT